MNSAADSGGELHGFIAVMIVIWEWLERLVASAWTGLGWPQVILIIFLMSVIYFKEEVRSIIPRIKKIGKDGFEVETPQTQPSTKVGEIKNPPVGQFSHTFGIVYEMVKKQIETKRADEAVEYLLSDDVEWRVLWYFENTYSYIFGGQIMLLEVLNQRGAVGLSLVEAAKEWEAHKARNKPHMDDRTMQPYLHFLISKDLIVMSEVDLKITLIGKEFLMWMAKFGRSSQRPW